MMHCSDNTFFSNLATKCFYVWEFGSVLKYSNWILISGMKSKIKGFIYIIYNVSDQAIASFFAQVIYNVKRC